MYNLVLIVVLLVIFTNCIYFYLKLKMLPQWKIDFQSKDDDNDDKWNPDLCQTYKGDKLAKLKVRTSQKRCAELLKGNNRQVGLFGKIKASLKK